VYKHLPDCEVVLDVCRPDDAATRPGIVFIHGGALIGGSRAGIRPAQRDRYLAARSCVVSTANAGCQDAAGELPL
jgi:carboxylesterase type B